MAAGINYEEPRMYKNPPTVEGSFPQLRLFYWQRKSLIDLKKEQYFGQLADTTTMPQHYGKTIKLYHYIPLLDDRNINDQGIDATGSVVTDEVTITITDPAGMSRYAVGNGSNAATALTAARGKALDIMKNLGMTYADYNAGRTALTAAGWTVTEGKDVGTIAGKLPVISETGGRVNRVGFTRVSLEGTIANFGFFEEYTEDSVHFDTDDQLMQHISRETTRGANELTEDMLQIDLLNAANVVYYGGSAISMNTVTGEGANPSVLDYETLIRVETALNDNRCPTDTTIITGSRMTDTKTIGATRYAYCGSELKMTLLKMKDFHGERAFIPIQQYGEAGKIATGEIGSIAGFHFIEVPEMMHWEGAGAAVNNNPGYLESNGKYNVYPLLIVGSKSFTTIGFQTSGNSTKFKIMHKAPGAATADRNDPYGKTGIYSIQWYYGFMALRPEWIACIKVVAER